MTDPVQQHLRAIASMGSKLGSFLLKHGRAFKHDAQTFEGKRMEPKNCFGNATTLVLLRHDLTYVEGFVETVVPIHHAWAMRPDGGIIDPTLSLTGVSGKPRPIGGYFGVPFDREFVSEAMVVNKYYGLLDGMSEHSRKLMSGQIDPVQFLPNARLPT